MAQTIAPRTDRPLCRRWWRTRLTSSGGSWLYSSRQLARFRKHDECIGRRSNARAGAPSDYAYRVDAADDRCERLSSLLAHSSRHPQELHRDVLADRTNASNCDARV